MKNKFLKEKAIFIILILISSTFIFPVFSQEAKAEEQQGCCQKLKNDEYCRMTTQSNCESGFNLVEDCSEDSICSSENQVCCYNSDSGECFPDSSQIECSDKGLESSSDKNCNSVSQCQKGCCVIGSNCNYWTRTKCQIETGKYPNLNLDFREGLGEFDCENTCREMPEGCCVTDGTFIFGKQVDCKGEFKLGKECSELPNSPCQAHKSMGCYDGDVYYEDSCGNKEDIKEECNLDDSKFCKDNQEENKAECLDTSCKDPYTDMWNIHDPGLGKGKIKQEGEAWCIYESPTGNYYDRPGSIHYRHYCLQGLEIVEPCRTFREQVCIQGSSEGGNTEFKELQDIAELGLEMFSPISPGDFPMILNDKGISSAECIENNIYDSKVTTDVSTVPLGFAFWESPGLGGQLSTPLQFILTAIQGQISGSGPMIGQMLSNTFDVQGSVTNALADRPDLPRTEPNDDATSRCSQANEQKTVKYLVGKDCPGCIENCYAEEEVAPMIGRWITKKAEQCKALGDCGVDFGVEATEPSGLFSFNAYWTGSAPGPKPWLIDPAKIIEWGTKVGVYKGMKKLSGQFNRILPQVLARVSGSEPSLGNKLGRGVIIGGIGGGAVTLASFTGMSTTIFSSSASSTLGSVLGGTVSVAVLAIGIAEGDPSTIGTGVGGLTGVVVGALYCGPFAPVCAGIGAILGGLVGSLFGKCKEETKTVTVTCNPWQPVPGGKNCDKCRNEEKSEKLKNADGSNFNTCTEYRCRALGASCKFLPDSENSNAAVTGACVEDNPNDVNSPKISPNYPEFEKQEIKKEDIEEYSRGFKITKLIPAYQPFTIALLTDELAICSYSIGTPKNKFEDMDETITTTFTQDHRILIPHPSSDPNKETTTNYYVICQDTHGNPKSTTASYEIEFTTKQEPDLSPPIIDLTLSGLTVQNFVKNGETESNFLAFVYDSSKVECRWYNKEEKYDSMPEENQLNCPGERQDTVYYQCQGTFRNIQQGENNFYISCKDQSESHWVSDPKKVTLTGTSPLQVAFPNDPPKPPSPPEVFYDNAFTLTVITSGGAENGLANCEYSLNEDPFMKFKKTDSNIHQQDQGPLVEEKKYHYDIKCTDKAGNIANEQLEFIRGKDTNPPRLVWLTKEYSTLNIYLNEISTCKYDDKEFNFEDGLLMGTNAVHHTAPLDKTYYYIKCKDSYGNDFGPIEVYNL